jgi:DNA repair protein RecO (recombination protein O)
MLHKTKAIVLKSIKHGESGVIVQVYTEEFGRQSFIVHSVRKRKSNYSFALFEPLSIISIDLYFKVTHDIHTVKEAKPCMVLHNLHSDVRKSSIAIFIGEILFRSLKEIEPNKDLFSFIFHAIQVLEMTEKGIEYFHLIFLFQFSKYLGIFPKNDENFLQLTSEKDLDFNSLVNSNFQNMEFMHIERPLRIELLQWLVNYYQKNLDGMGEIKSLHVLKEVFQ